MVPLVPAAPNRPCAVELRPGGAARATSMYSAGDENAERRSLDQTQADHPPHARDHRVREAARGDADQAPSDERQEPALPVDEAARERREEQHRQREREERHADQREARRRGWSCTRSR